IIHVHSTFAGLFVRLPLIFLPKKDIKIIYCSHGWSFLMETSLLAKNIYIKIEKSLANVTTKIINISKYEQVESIKVGMPESKSILIYNGTKKIKNKKNYSFNVRDIEDSKINILFVGRFDRQKGIDILLDVIRNTTLKNIHLYLIGDSVLSKGDIPFNLPENVTKIGWVNKEEIDIYYQSIDAVIIPSRWEGFGLVAIEAMKNKKAVIASNRGALPELIIDGTNGFIFDINNINTLNLILESLDKETLKTLGENGYKYYNENFTCENMNIKILNVYSSILGEKLEMLKV
ncbi:glycosyltransferase, partial [Peribacillus muralis]